MWIHEQSATKRYTTVCGLAMNPFMQTTIKWAGEKPTCPECRKALGLPPLPVRSPSP